MTRSQPRRLRAIARRQLIRQFGHIPGYLEHVLWPEVPMHTRELCQFFEELPGRWGVPHALRG